MGDKRGGATGAKPAEADWKTNWSQPSLDHVGIETSQSIPTLYAT